MYTVTLSVIAILAAFLSKPSAAQASGANSILDMGAPPIVMSVTYKNLAAQNFGTEKSSASPSPASVAVAVAVAGPSHRSIHKNSMSTSIDRANMLTGNDQFSSTIYAPMQGVNNVLSLVEAAFHSSLDDTLIAWIQALSVIARRQINTELAYSVKVSKTSKFDSVLSYKLDPGSDSGKPTVIASLQYHAKF